MLLRWVGSVNNFSCLSDLLDEVSPLIFITELIELFGPNLVLLEHF